MTDKYNHFVVLLKDNSDFLEHKSYVGSFLSRVTKHGQAEDQTRWEQNNSFVVLVNDALILVDMYICLGYTGSSYSGNMILLFIVDCW